MGHVTTTDSLIKDGLWDPYNNFHMGTAAELCVKKYAFSREEQDQFARESYEKAIKAQSSGAFKNEIVPVEVFEKKRKLEVLEDEEPGKANFEKMGKLRPAFDREGTITPANASKINDGASALVLAGKSYVDEKKLKAMAQVVGYASFAQDPKWFTTAPVMAIKKVCDKTGLKTDEIDLFEINEAFSAVTMLAQRELSISREKINIHGGAVALGHPIGCSGARILTTLLHALKPIIKNMVWPDFALVVVKRWP